MDHFAQRQGKSRISMSIEDHSWRGGMFYLPALLVSGIEFVIVFFFIEKGKLWSLWY